jgi:uncharacterized surface protein with fasciclin (FAS1) repeats
MKKSQTLALVVAIAVVLCFVLATGTPAQADRWSGRYHRGATILDKLEDTDGAQALVAAVLFVDESASDADPKISELLDDRRERLTLLAPDNTGFEVFLKLPPGALDGLSIDNIVGILKSLAVDPAELLEVLLRHVSVEGRQTKRDLLRAGEITVLGSDYPVSIGGAAGVWIGYANAITQADVFTVNGVIHYLDKVITEPPPPDPPDEFNVCQERDSCKINPETRDKCNTFLNDCLEVAETDSDIEGCVGGALLICLEIEIEPEPPL